MMDTLHRMPPRSRRLVAGRTLVGLTLFLPILLTALCIDILAVSYSPWIREVSFTGPQRFDIYDRQAGALVQNPIYQHYDLSTDPQSDPAGFVHSSAVTLQAGLDGAVPISGPPILVRVTPTVYINDTSVAVNPPMVTTTVGQWPGSDFVFRVDAPYGVGKHQISVTWDLATSGDGGQTWTTESGDASDHTLYTSLMRPIVSRTYLGQRPERGNPWIDMLERATTWAAGLADDVQIMEALTRMFWANSDHIYDGGAHSTPTDYNTLNVERFLDPTIDPQADCRDMSNFLALLGRSLGLDVTTLRIRGGITGFSSFWTQYLGPHGGRQPAFVINSAGFRLFTSLNHTWTQTRWNYHQVALYRGKLYDACAMIELDPNIPRNPGNYINHRNVRQDEAARYGLQYIPPGDYSPNNGDFLLGYTYSEYQPFLVLDEAPFRSSSHIEQQGAAPVVR